MMSLFTYNRDSVRVFGENSATLCTACTERRQRRIGRVACNRETFCPCLSLWLSPHSRFRFLLQLQSIVTYCPTVSSKSLHVSQKGHRRKYGISTCLDLRSRRYLENFHQHPWKFGFVFLPFFFSAAAAKKVAVFFSSDQNSAVAQALTKAFSELC